MNSKSIGKTLLLTLGIIAIAGCYSNVVGVDDLNDQSSQFFSGCRLNDAEKPGCSTEWVKDKKGEIFVLTWSDGDKTTVRQMSKNLFRINEKDYGEIIAISPYLTFKNSTTGSTFSVPLGWFGEQRISRERNGM